MKPPSGNKTKVTGAMSGTSLDGLDIACVIFEWIKNKIGQRPIDFPQTDKPLLGYYGAFSEWLDYDIIRKHADENKYHIIMIGGNL